VAVFLLHVGCIYPSSPFSLLNLPKSAFNLKRLSGHLNDELALRGNLKSEIALNFPLKRLFIGFGKLRFFLTWPPFSTLSQSRDGPGGDSRIDTHGVGAVKAPFKLIGVKNPF
jgi:hypothetical protein